MFNRILELLPELLPAAYPIDACRRRISASLDGVCWRDRSEFRIRVANDLPEHFAIDVLIHEWAHALAWPRNLRVFDYLSPMERERRWHGPAWGRAYANVYATVNADIVPAIRREELAARRRRRSGCRK